MTAALVVRATYAASRRRSVSLTLRERSPRPLLHAPTNPERFTLAGESVLRARLRASLSVRLLFGSAASMAPGYVTY